MQMLNGNKERGEQILTTETTRNNTSKTKKLGLADEMTSQNLVINNEGKLHNTQSSPSKASENENAEPMEGSGVMRVKVRDGSLEPVDLNKIVQKVSGCAEGLTNVEPMRVATNTISGLVDGATTEELDLLSIRTAASYISEEPNYSKLAARLLATVVSKEARNQNVETFFDSVQLGYDLGLIAEDTFNYVKANQAALDSAIDHSKDWLFEFFGLRTVYDRYLLKHPTTRKVIETPQFFFLRVACGLANADNKNSVPETINFYNLISSLEYLPSSPTLFNSGTVHSQMSSCYLLDSPIDSLDGIYDKYKDIARLSKHAGGIGVSFSRIRSRGSLIKGTNGLSSGIVPWLKTLDSSVGAVNQGGRRKGAACVYMETWHGDIEEFLELRDNTGDEARRAHNLNIANWVPDLFMKRVEQDWQWSLFDPKEVPELVDLYGAEFEEVYLKAENEGRYIKQVSARDLYSRMMRTLAQTGNGWMTFKDASNLKSNQTGEPQNVIHLSNLCTEILEVTNNEETAVCNLGSINLGKCVEIDDSEGGSGKAQFNYDKLGEIISVAMPLLDRVIDINFYPTESAKASNEKWRPVGLGIMGLQDVFFKLGLPFDSEEARQVSKNISEEVYYHMLRMSCDLAKTNGSHKAFDQTRAAKGDLQFDLWKVEPSQTGRWEGKWEKLKAEIKEYGLRNSLLIAIAPTATIASIAGCYECIEPQVSNLFKRETLSGEFLQINSYLVKQLQAMGLWTEEIMNKVKVSEGSIQDIDEIPEDIKHVYRTAWEISMKSLIEMAADRGAFIDQSQSLNLFIESPTIGKLSSMYMHAWKNGIKTTYYLRSRPATKINKTTVSTGATSSSTAKKTYTDEEALACSLENPESCEACD